MSIEWVSPIDPGDGSDLGYLRVTQINLNYESQTCYVQVRGWKTKAAHDSGNRVTYEAGHNPEWNAISAVDTRTPEQAAEDRLLTQPEYPQP